MCFHYRFIRLTSGLICNHLPKARNLLLPVLVLLLLSWALGSLSRGMPGGSLLFNSYWLLYILYFVPFLALGALVLLAVLIIWNLRDLSDGLGSGIARKVKKRKKHWAVRILIFFYAWVFVLIFLESHCGGVVCSLSDNSNLQGLGAIVGARDPSSSSSIATEAVAGLTGVFSWGWFLPASIVLLLASSLVMGRSLVVSLREWRQGAEDEIRNAKKQGFAAVQEAIKTVSAMDSTDPRIRIVLCFERLVMTASRLGAVASPDQTAREIEMSIRRTFLLEGPATSRLTALFEEARYSLHPISEENAKEAREYLIHIAEELKR